MSNAIRKLVSVAEKRVTGKVFCTSCQTEREETNGVYRTVGSGRKRFVCAGCSARARRVSSIKTSGSAS